MRKNGYNGLYPGVIRSYDANTREARVSVAGITDGGGELPIAEIKYPIGDRSRETEIEILENDMVWVQFIGGDGRYPVIDGYRNPMTGNRVGVRRIHHDVIEIEAGVIKLIGDVEISGGSLTHEGKNVGATHAHSGVMGGSNTSGQPV